MIRGYYTALSGMIAAADRQDVVADAIANANTVGYKQTRINQADFDMEVASSLGQDLGPLGTATYATDMTLDGSAGAIQQTDVPTDLAIEGDGMFAVRTPSGTAYTRGGDFHVDTTGRLVTEQGYAVLDTTGADIIVNGPFTVAADGSIAGSAQRLAIAAMPASGLTRLGDNLYATTSPLPASTGSKVWQGALEQSNVDLAAAMTDLMMLQRMFSLNARALSLQSDTLTSANDVGRLK